MVFLSIFFHCALLARSPHSLRITLQAGRQAGRPWAIQSDVLVIPDGDVSSVAAGWVYLAEDCSRKTRKVSKTNVHYLPSEASANQKEILLWRFWRLALTSQLAPPFAFGQIHLSSRTYHALPTSMARRRESPSPTRRASAWPKPLPRPPPAVKALPLGKAAPHVSSWSPRHERTLCHFVHAGYFAMSHAFPDTQHWKNVFFQCAMFTKAVRALTRIVFFLAGITPCPRAWPDAVRAPRPRVGPAHGLSRCRGLLQP